MRAESVAASAPRMTGLDRYVFAADGGASWDADAPPAVADGGGVTHTLRLRSQVWRGRTWTHRLYAAVPGNAELDGPMWLYVTGNGDHGMEWMLLQALAARAHCPVAMLCEVPNEPLDGLSEDSLIADTFERFLEGQDPEAADWPLLLPMTKAAVRAMDALQEWTKAHGVTVRRFIVSGASKRGWTTYLTAAVDRRVAGLAPLVYDNLNLAAQLRRQHEVFGPDLSPEIGDYVAHHITSAIGEGKVRAQELLEMVDPYAYRDRLTQPKCLLLGTNDPYWPVDALRLYREDLAGPTSAAYFPNCGHGLGDPSRVLGALLRLHAAVTVGSPLPQVRLDAVASGARARLDATADGGGSLRLWRATADDQDFRKATWAAEPLADGPRWSGEIPTLTGQWQALYVETDVDVPALPGKLGLDSPVVLVPPAE